MFVRLRMLCNMDSFKKYLLILTSVLCFFSCGKDDAPALPLVTPADSSVATEVLRLVNVHRQSQGLSSLTMNDVIAEQALFHSVNMANGSVPFGNNGFDDRVSKIMTGLGISGGTYAENVARGFETPQDVVSGWIANLGHRTNIEGNYTLTGIGVASDSDGNPYYTQLFYK